MAESGSGVMLNEKAITPPDVLAAFKLILAGIVDGTTIIMKARTADDMPHHYMIARISPDGEHVEPLAMIPCGLTLLNFLQNYDAMVKTHGGPESDPDFKGVRQ